MIADDAVHHAPLNFLHGRRLDVHMRDCDTTISNNAPHTALD